MTLPQSLQPSELIQAASKAELQSAFHPHHLPLLTPLGVASTHQASAKPEISGTAFKSLTTPMSRALWVNPRDTGCSDASLGSQQGLGGRASMSGMCWWITQSPFWGPSMDQLWSKPIAPICLFVFHRSKVLRALNLSLPVWWSSPNKPSCHVTSTLPFKNRMAGWGGALRREKRGKHCKSCILVTALAELENRRLHLQLIRLTQLRLQMESLAQATSSVGWTCVILLPLNITTCMTYFVFSWPLGWKTVKTTSALLSNWIRGKEQASLVSLRLCLGNPVTAANHFPTPKNPIWMEREFSAGSSALNQSKTKLPSDLGSGMWSPPWYIPCVSNSLL